MDRFSLPSLGHVASYLEEEKPPPPGRQAEVPSYDGLVAALAALPPIGTVVAPADRGAIWRATSSALP